MPMTLSSFIDVRPPAAAGVATTLVCTTVSTRSRTITLAITGLRMSARTKSAEPEVAARRYDVDPDGALDARGSRELGHEASPEITGDAGDEYDLAHGGQPQSMSAGYRGYLPRRRRWTRVFFSSLRCFFFAMRLRRFLMTEPTCALSLVR